MKVFDKNQDSCWESKVNFVDDNNIGVGYDMSQNCCEHADWFIADSPAKTPDGPSDQDRDLEGYSFDTDYFETVEDSDGQYVFDAGAMVIFRLVSSEKLDKYLHLYNCHNGYYSHGWDMTDGPNKIQSGSL